MTDVTALDSVVSSAVTAAQDAAAQAGVVVREVHTIEEQAGVVELLSHIWGRTMENPAIPPELLRALGKAGSYIAAAYEGDRIVGATVGFHSMPDRRALHSHIAGVAPGIVGRAIGFAMKLHQRAWALEHGIDVVEWTYDPLVARNAHFNLTKLHALPAQYLANFYGSMSDAINGGDDTDRLLVRWDLRAPEVVEAAAGRSRPVDPSPPGRTVVAVPDDIESLRRTDPDAARAWRREVRERLTGLLADDARIIGFERGVGYIIRLGEQGGTR